MDTLDTLQRRLKEMAEEVAAMRWRMTSPVNIEAASLQEAADTLRAALGAEKFFSLSFDLDFSGNDSRRLTWKVYHSSCNFEAATLPGAVALALADLQPQTADPVQAAQAVLAQSEPMPQNQPIPF